MEAIVNPYKDVSFNNRIPSVSHEHCRDLTTAPTITAARIFNYLYRDGIRHFAFSNYYPSEPIYPIDNPSDPATILTGTQSSEFETLPSDAVGCPNAEHHDMNIGSLHINGIGSTFTSGSPKGSTPVGMGGRNWQTCFNSIFSELIYADGGGATINHPDWTDYYGKNLKANTVMKMLDYDDRVLGIEIFNSTCDRDVSDTGFSIELWDTILKTGRRCWGFCVPDHDGENFTLSDTSTPPIKHCPGRNVLLCEADEHSCLKAYRSGAFYGQIYNSDLAFTNIEYNDSTNNLSVVTIGAEKIDVIIDGITTTYNSGNVSVTVPDGSTYVRVVGYKAMQEERYLGEYDMIFSNPIMFKSANRSKKSSGLLLFN